MLKNLSGIIATLFIFVFCLNLGRTYFGFTGGLELFFKKDCSMLYKKLLKKDTLSVKQKHYFFKQSQDCIDYSSSKRILENLLKRSIKNQQVLEGKKIEKTLAKLSFYKWKNFDSAIKHYQSLLTRPLAPGEKFLFQYQTALSYFFLEKYSQALIEVEKCFFKGISTKQRKKALFLKIQGLIFKKRFLEAERLLKQQIEKLSQNQDFLREYLALVYESQNKFLLAIEELKKIKNKSFFIKKQIFRLEERQNNQPGF